jgi:hypothetical protein
MSVMFLIYPCHYNTRMRKNMAYGCPINGLFVCMILKIEFLKFAFFKYLLFKIAQAFGKTC